MEDPASSTQGAALHFSYTLSMLTYDIFHGGLAPSNERQR